jgi:DNA-binding CsgD family transcriptional regulator
MRSMLRRYSSSYDAENDVYMTPAANDHLNDQPPASRRKLYDAMRNRMRLQQARSVRFIEQGEKLVACILSNTSGGKSVIDTSFILDFPTPSEELLAELFGLSPAEARLAQQIARGDSLEDIAADAGIKMSTARSQLASVFYKTGTQRQPKLVALLCRLAHLSAPPVLETISP